MGDEEESLVDLRECECKILRRRKERAYASKTHDVLEGEARKDVVEVDVEGDTEKEAGGILFGILDEAISPAEGGEKG
jgi:hypothetical protein